MVAREFVHKAIQLYHSARVSDFPDPKIKRGRSRSISSQLEDLFASFLISNIACEYIYVDQPISVPGVKTTRYPDIAIMRGGMITGFCDLKTDLGYARNGLVELCRRHYQWLEKTRDSDCTLKDGVTKEAATFRVSSTATYSVVVLSERNINLASLNKQIAEAYALFYPTVEVFVMTSKLHLNEYGFTPEALVEKIEVRDSVFTKLINKLSK